MIRTLIVDDEHLARRHISALLATQRDFEIVGEAEHGAQAITCIQDLRPDLVFLDIQMPEITGLEVMDAVGVDAMPMTVFVTAYDVFALKAFELQALDYILKPFDDLRFSRVLDRVRSQIGKPLPADQMRGLLGDFGQPMKLAARSHGVVRLIRLDDVDWIAAAGDYAEVHVGHRAMLLNESMASLEVRLPSNEFARIHRSVIVRLDRLIEVRSGSHGDGTVRLTCGAELRFSRRYRQPIDAYLTRGPA